MLRVQILPFPFSARVTTCQELSIHNPSLEHSSVCTNEEVLPMASICVTKEHSVKDGLSMTSLKGWVLDLMPFTDIVTRSNAKYDMVRVSV